MAASKKITGWRQMAILEDFDEETMDFLRESDKPAAPEALKLVAKGLLLVVSEHGRTIKFELTDAGRAERARLGYAEDVETK